MRFTRFASGFSRGKKKGPNKTELAYEAHLATQKLVGQILDYGYEWITLKLADDTRYTPDFYVLALDYVIEMHEVKAGRPHPRTGEITAISEDASRIKLRVAAERFPFRFRLACQYQGNWHIKEIP